AGIGMLAGSAGANEAVLCPAIAFNLCVFERSPVALLFAEASDMGTHDIVKRCLFEFGGALMPGGRHRCSFVFSVIPGRAQQLRCGSPGMTLWLKLPVSCRVCDKGAEGGAKSVFIQ